MAHVFLPYNLRKYAKGEREVNVPGDTLGDLIRNMEKRYPGISEHLLDEGGKRLKIGLAAVCGTTETRQGLLQPLGPDIEVHFIQAISGGR